MNQLMTTNTMTSMEIANFTNKRHDNIMRDIKDEIEKLEISGINTNLKFELRERKDSTGRTIPYYNLTKEGILQLAARYDAVVRAKLIDLAMRESNPQPQLPQTYSEALRALANEWEEKQKLLPKAESFDKFISAENYQDMNSTAKVLGYGRNKLFKELRERKIIRNNNTPYQEYIDRGYFVVKEKPINMSDRVENYAQTFVTAKGINWLSKLLVA